jgi:hypothetical protein|tara:strand:- start:129 stop:419 length:291 start_codon:yes stop_codon:yes gene_type:complete
MENNKRILKLIEKRLEVGAKEHGAQVPLNGTRDHLQDAIEEALDMIVYLAAMLIEIKRKESKWLKMKRSCITICSKLGLTNMKKKCKSWMSSLTTY